MSEETTAILAIAADRFLTGRHQRARDLFEAIARGEDPRAPGHVVCVRNGHLFDVELPVPQVTQATAFIAHLFRAEHVIGLDEQLDVTPADPQHAPLIPTPDDIGVRLWASETWLEQRTEVHVSDRYVSFPKTVQWTEPDVSLIDVDRFLFDYEAVFAPNALTDEQARVILEHKGCRVTDADLDRELDRWITEFGPVLDRDFGPEIDPPFGSTAD